MLNFNFQDEKLVKFSSQLMINIDANSVEPDNEEIRQLIRFGYGPYMKFNSANVFGEPA